MVECPPTAPVPYAPVGMAYPEPNVALPAAVDERADEVDDEETANIASQLVCIYISTIAI